MDAPTLPPQRQPACIQDHQAGVTLVELLVALALFGLIGLAGLGLLSSIVDVRERTEGRLERLSDLQRAFRSIGDDAMQADAGTLRIGPDGLGFDRKLPNRSASSMIRYGLQNGDLMRSAQLLPPERLLDRIDAVRWRLLLSTGETADTWPPDLETAGEPATPRALELVLTLSPSAPGTAGEIRRVIDLAVPP